MSILENTDVVKSPGDDGAAIGRIGARGTPGLGEGFHDDFFSVIAIGKQAIREREQCLAVAVIECAQGRFVPARHPADESGIGLGPRARARLVRPVHYEWR